MDLHQSANQEWNLYRAWDSSHRDQDWKLKRFDAEYIYTHVRVAHLLFRRFEFSQYHQLVQVAFWAKVASVAVETHLCLCTTSASVDCVQCRIGKRGSRPFHFHEPLLSVFLSQYSPYHAREIQHHLSSHLGLWCEVSWWVVAFAQLRHSKTLLGPFWPY